MHIISSFFSCLIGFLDWFEPIEAIETIFCFPLIGLEAIIHMVIFIKKMFRCFSLLLFVIWVVGSPDLQLISRFPYWMIYPAW